MAWHVVQENFLYEALLIFIPLSLAMTTLVYFGSCTDVWPILRYSYLHRTFVYVDGLPDSRYWPSGCHGDTIGLNTFGGFITIFKTNLEAAGIDIKSCDTNGDTVTITTTLDIVIKLFLNTLDRNAWEKPDLRSYLDKAETLFLMGYMPQIVGPLPALKRIICSDNCDPTINKSGGLWCIDPDQYTSIRIDEYEQMGIGMSFTVHGGCCYGCTDRECSPSRVVMYC